jgi:hypothetical protein
VDIKTDIGITSTNIQAKLYEINFTITQRLRPFPTILSAYFIKNWSKNMKIKIKEERKKGII